MNIVIAPLADLQVSQSNEITAHQMLGFTNASWVDAYKSLGPVFKVVIGEREHTVLCGHDANLEAWRRPDDWNYKDTDSGNFFRSEMGAGHVTQLNGEAHRRLRKLILPAIGIKALTRDFDAVLASMMKSFTGLAGDSFDLYETANLAYARALSVSQVKADMTDETIKRLADFEEWFIAGLRIRPDEQQKFHATEEYLSIKSAAYEMFEQVVAERQSGIRRHDSFDMMFDDPTALGFPPLDHAELVQAVYLLSIAGIGNVANQLSASLSLLVKHPQWLDKLRNELAQGDLFDMKAGMACFPIMKAVIAEVERYYQPAPVIQKMTMRDVNILGRRIPAGESVLHIHGLSHFDSDFYEQPFDFNPGRWLQGSIKKPLAFGGGKHLCLGMGVARLFVPLSIAIIVKAYDIQAMQAPISVILAPNISSSPATTRFDVQLTPR
jgi:cytochrome P450